MHGSEQGGQPGGGHAARWLDQHGAARTPTDLHGAVGPEQHWQRRIQRIQRRRGLRHPGTVPRPSEGTDQLSTGPSGSSRGPRSASRSNSAIASSIPLVSPPITVDETCRALIECEHSSRLWTSTKPSSLAAAPAATKRSESLET